MYIDIKKQLFINETRNKINNLKKAKNKSKSKIQYFKIKGENKYSGAKKT